jgi:ribosome biogenesis GTPase
VSEAAVVARVDFGACVLLREDGSLVGAKVSGGLLSRRKSLDNAVVVGDRVGFEPLVSARAGVDGHVTTVEPRRNAFARGVASGRVVEQVVAANLDQVVLVASLDDPPFSPGLADRVLCQAEHSGLPARLVLNKTDLADQGQGGAAAEILDAYERAGVPGHAVSARLGGAPLDELRHACRGRRSLFVGHSGVGKSTLLNALIPALDLLEGAVNQKTGKGRHTTTAALLVRPEPGFELIDTPGVRTFSLWGIGPRDLDQSYREFHPFLGSCRFNDCRHRSEPGCAVQAATEDGRIARRRYQSYLKLLEELEAEAGRPA